jgi:hypothetical protein
VGEGGKRLKEGNLFQVFTDHPIAKISRLITDRAVRVRE